MFFSDQQNGNDFFQLFLLHPKQTTACWPLEVRQESGGESGAPGELRELPHEVLEGIDQSQVSGAASGAEVRNRCNCVQKAVISKAQLLVQF